MRVSINVTSYPAEAGAASLGRYLADLGQAADHAGIDTVWVADHLVQCDPRRTMDEAMLEAFATLGYLAHATTRVRLGTMVAAVTYRAPALLIKTATTLDVLSGGRAWLGLGAGYQDVEARAMGLDLPAVGERFARLEETLQIARQMFEGRADAYRGTHHQLDRPMNNPSLGPLPILIGGAGERRTLRLVARYADACNLFDMPDAGATIRHKLEVLRRHCDDLDRDYARIDKTVSTHWAPATSVAELEDDLATLAGHGATHAVLIRDRPWTPDDLRKLSAVDAP